MLHGPCPTFVVVNHQHHLNRYDYRNGFSLIFLDNLWLMVLVYLFIVIIIFVSLCSLLYSSLVLVIHMFQVKPALPILRQLIYLNDEEVLTDACWALSYLSDGPNDKIQAVIEAGVCPRLVELLGLVLFFLTNNWLDIIFVYFSSYLVSL